MNDFINDFQNQDRELSYDDVITNDAQEFVTLTPGEYEFKIAEIEKTRYAGSDKANGLPPCPQVNVKVHVHTPEGVAVVTDRLYLHNRVEWRLSAFFAAIGQKKKGEPFRMDWNIIGKTGRAVFKNRLYEGKSYNDLDRYVLPKDYEGTAAPQQQAPTWQSGSF